jgi:PadR family transcriptional regulator
MGRRDRRPSRQTRRVLEVLLAAPDEWHHGYDLMERTGLKAGTLYPILIRLAEREILETRWEEAPPRGRPPRHLYRLAGDGEAAAVALGVPKPALPARAAIGRTA